jgi:DNA polymerase III epsilon subunit
MAVTPIFSVVDTETTGFRFDKGARLLEVAVVRMDADGTIQGTFSSLVNPGDDIDLGAIDIHGITRSMLADAPTFAEIAGDFVSIVEGTLLVAHNAPFDTPFLAGELELAGYGWPAQHVLDTLGAARFLLPGLPSYKLGALAEHLGITFEGNAHAALADALVTAKLHAALLAKTENLKWPDPSAIQWPRATPSGLAKSR